MTENDVKQQKQVHEQADHRGDGRTDGTGMWRQLLGWVGPSILSVPFFGAATSLFGTVSFPVDTSNWSRSQRAGPVQGQCAAGTAEQNASQFLPRDRLRSG